MPGVDSKSQGSLSPDFLMAGARKEGVESPKEGGRSGINYRGGRGG